MSWRLPNVKTSILLIYLLFCYRLKFILNFGSLLKFYGFLMFFNLFIKHCSWHIVRTEVMINSLNMLGIVLSIKSLERDMLPWRISAGTLKGYSWNNVFKENIQACNMSQNALDSQEEYHWNSLSTAWLHQTQTPHVGDQLKFNLTHKEKKKTLLLVVKVITFSSLEKTTCLYKWTLKTLSWY